MARNGKTNAPNLFRKVPKKRSHAPRGSARRFSLRLVVLWSILRSVGSHHKTKKPIRLSADGFENLFCSLHLPGFQTPTAMATDHDKSAEPSILTLPNWQRSCRRHMLRLTNHLISGADTTTARANVQTISPEKTVYSHERDG